MLSAAVTLTCSLLPQNPPERSVHEIPTRYHLATESETPLRAVSRPIQVRIDPEREDDQGRELGEVAVGERKVLVAVAATSDSKPLRIWIDADADGRLVEDESVEATPRRVRNRTVWSARGELRVAGRTVRVSAFKGPDRAFVVSVSLGYLYGKLALGDEELHFAAINADDDVAFGSSGDRWTLLDTKTLETFNSRYQRGRYVFRAESMIERDEPVFLAGHRMAKLLGIDEHDAARVAIGPATESISDYLHRRAERVFEEWNERFEGPYKQMLARYVEDRPKASKPIPWIHALDLEEVLARAKRENKPILADFETDWCIWCKVLDKLTYPDAEVTELISKHFVPVKLNAELMANDLTKKYGIRGYPGIAIIAPDGTKVDHISGFSPPSRFVELLRKALEKFEAHKAGN